MKYAHPFIVSALVAVAAITAVGTAHAMPSNGEQPMPMMMMGHGGPNLDRLDLNKDGKVSKEEFMAPELKRFADVDSNSDGKISKEEWAAAKPAFDMMAKKLAEWQASASPAEKALYDAHKAAQFRSFDANSDGVISKDEFTAMRGLTFAALDSNQDGVLDVPMMPRHGMDDDDRDGHRDGHHAGKGDAKGGKPEACAKGNSDCVKK